MSLRFWRRVRLAPGVTLNLSKSTASLSFGPRGAKYTVSPRGNRSTVGIPGTGLFYTVQDRKTPAVRSGPTTRDKLSLGFFRRLVTPPEEKALVDGLRALHEGDETTALRLLEDASDLSDGAWMAGMIRLKREDLAQARQHLEAALARADQLGSHFTKYGITPQIDLPIAQGVSAHIRPCERGTRLSLVEICEAGGDLTAAKKQLERLIQIAPDDPVVVLSFVQVALDASDDRALMDRVIAMTAATQNDSPIDTGVLLYRAKALARRGLPDAAIDVLTGVLRRRKDRPEPLLHQIRYDRADLYERIGRRAQSRREFERLYAEVPGFEGLPERLGLE